MNASRLHTVLLAELSRMAAHPWRVRTHTERAAARMPQSSGLVEQVKAAERRLQVVNKKVDNLMNAIATSNGPTQAMLVRKVEAVAFEQEELAAEVRRLNRELAAVRSWRLNGDVLQETLSLFGQLWERRTDEERSCLLALLVERVERKNRQVVEVTLLPVLSELLRVAPRELGSSASLRDGKALLL